MLRVRASRSELPRFRTGRLLAGGGGALAGGGAEPSEACLTGPGRPPALLCGPPGERTLGCVAVGLLVVGGAGAKAADCEWVNDNRLVLAESPCLRAKNSEKQNDDTGNPK